MLKILIKSAGVMINQPLQVMFHKDLLFFVFSVSLTLYLVSTKQCKLSTAKHRSLKNIVNYKGSTVQRHDEIIPTRCPYW